MAFFLKTTEAPLTLMGDIPKKAQMKRNVPFEKAYDPDLHDTFRPWYVLGLFRFEGPGGFRKLGKRNGLPLMTGGEIVYGRKIVSVF